MTGDFDLSVGWHRARYSYRSIRNGKTIATPGVQDKLSLQSLRVSPQPVVRVFTGRLRKSG